MIVDVMIKVRSKTTEFVLRQIVTTNSTRSDTNDIKVDDINIIMFMIDMMNQFF